MNTMLLLTPIFIIVLTGFICYLVLRFFEKRAVNGLARSIVVGQIRYGFFTGFAHPWGDEGAFFSKVVDVKRGWVKYERLGYDKKEYPKGEPVLEKDRYGYSQIVDFVRLYSFVDQSSEQQK